MPEDKFRFGEIKRAIISMKSTLPPLLANDVRNYSLKAFKDQGFEGSPWKEVKRRIPGTPEYMYPKKKDLRRRTRPILVGKGSTKLRRAVADSIESDTWPKIKLFVNLIYAARHNYGLDGMPERPFMRDTERLRKILRKRIIREANRVFFKK